MVNERLDAASKLPANETDVRQFAITQARAILRNAGVVDPGPKARQAREARGKKKTRPHMREITPSEQEFVDKLKAQVALLPTDLPIGILIYPDKYSRNRLRRYLSSSAYSTEEKSELALEIKEVDQLPEAPATWQEFIANTSGHNASRLTRVLSLINQITNRGIHLPIYKVDDALHEYRQPDHWMKTEHLIHYVFGDIKPPEENPNP